MVHRRMCLCSDDRPDRGIGLYTIYLVGNYPDEISAKEEIGRYIERYHHHRPHQSLMNFTPAHVHEVNNKSRLQAELKEMKRKTREKRKAYWSKHEIRARPRLRGVVQARFQPRSSILGQIRRPFFKINRRILRTRVLQLKTTHLLIPFCLIEKKWTTPSLQNMNDHSRAAVLHHSNHPFATKNDERTNTPPVKDGYIQGFHCYYAGYGWRNIFAAPASYLQENQQLSHEAHASFRGFRNGITLALQSTERETGAKTKTTEQGVKDEPSESKFWL